MDRCSPGLLPGFSCWILLLLGSRYGSSQPLEVCSRSLINSCSDCIQSGPFCSWCQLPNFTRAGQQDADRCNTRAQLIAAGCTSDDIISPRNSEEVLQDRGLTESFDQDEPVQMRPQKIHLKLRPGLPSTFRVSFRRVEGYPVDLYYLMDLSYSMKDDLAQVKGLGQELFDALGKITKHAQIGFGAFVDKTVLPYTNTNPRKLLQPCDEDDQQCQAAFGYRHVLSLTSSRTDFQTKVSEQYISGNLDSPEGSLDAMMQASVCTKEIGWRNNSTRLIVLATDAGFHMAGDGKLAGILEPNDERCHIQNNLYTKSNYMDYPSVGQLAVQLERHNIQPIFAVTQNVQSVYQEFSKMIPKSEVGVLSSDSNNVVQLIVNAYNRLSSKVTLTHENLPAGVTVLYTPICDNGEPPSTKEGICNGVLVKQEISFDVTVTVTGCMQDQTFTIKPQGHKDALSVGISTTCDCKCSDPPEPNHEHCSRHGNITCGVCRCAGGFSGQFCSCHSGTENQSSLRAKCQRSNGTECEGRGECDCGQCQCYKSESGASYYGQFCQCDDEHCQKFGNKLCSGNGRCQCGTCVCSPGFEGTACECLKSVEGCRLVNGSVCFGRGRCKCGRCDCDQGYMPPHCQECLGCPDPCQTKLSCIECLGFGSGPLEKNCSAACRTIVAPRLVDKFSFPGKECRQKDSEACWITFKMEQLIGQNFTAEILKDRECPQPPSVAVIIGGTVAAVALIGIVLLALVKMVMYVRDLKEFKRFENEKKKSNWAKADNPLFEKATTTVSNPTFTGE